MSTAARVSPRADRSATGFLDAVADEGSFVSWDGEPQQPDASKEYAAELAKARERTGERESVVTGEARIRGRRVAVVVSEFGFLAGSIGVAASRRLAGAIDRATQEGLPVLAATASGGTRMQEGTPAFLGMIQVTAAVRRHRDAGLPYVVYLRNPTTGGVTASWGSLGHLTFAEPGALIGFLGPRVYEALYEEPFPAGVQSAENLYRHGLIDGVVVREDLPDVLDRTLAVLDARWHGQSVTPPPTTIRQPGSATAWERITLSRNPDRPDLRALLSTATDDHMILSGTGEGEKDGGILLALARFGQAPCVVVGHRRPRPGQPAMGPASLRTARRGIALAGELRLPLVTVIDTAGADLSPAAEEGGLAAEIARSLYDLVGVPTGTVSVLLGQGAGGGALALLPADRIIAAENAWLSPLPPEGASAILHRTLDRAPEVAQNQRVGADELCRIGLLDHVVDERPDAAAEPEAFCRRMAQAVEFEVLQVAPPSGDRVARRMARFDQLTT